MSDYGWHVSVEASDLYHEGTMTEGKIIVIDGADGSGKATQAEMLKRRLIAEGRSVESIDFPRYHDNLFGKLIAECLSGKYGDFLAVPPRIASTLYAADRYEAKPQLEAWLAEGKIIIADRYVSANQMHQGGKLTDPEEARQFLEWLDTMEFGVFGLPRPALVIYLDVPIVISARLAKEAKSDGKKVYLAGGSDQAEENLAHQEAARVRALSIVQASNEWRQVLCVHDGTLRSREDIHEDVYAAALSVLS